MLNTQQKQAVDANDGPLIILAGAGTGKTHTLTNRVASLIANGKKPERILLLTFTRKAAAEMLSRVDAILAKKNIPNNQKVFGGTFHASAFKLISQFNPTSAAAILDESDARNIVKKLLKKDDYQELNEVGIKPKKIIEIISFAANTRQSLKTVIAEKLNDDEQEVSTLVVKIANEYQQNKGKQGLVDYDDILVNWLNVLQDKITGDQVRALFDIVLIDEFQDCNQLQMDIIRELCREHRNFTAVGDDCQSIYSFRGARTHQVREFLEIFADTKIITLTENYRSTQKILDISNAVIANSRDVVPKELTAASQESGCAIEFIQAPTDENVAEKVIDAMIQSMINGTALEDQAVLYRSSFHCRMLEIALKKGQMNYQKYGGQKFSDSRHCKDFLSLICAGENPKNVLANLRSFQLIKGIGEKKSERLHECRLKGKSTPYKKSEAFTDLIDLWAMPRKTGQQLSIYLNALLSWYERQASPNLENFHERLNDLQLLIRNALQSENLETFLQENLLNDAPEEELLPGPTLSTIHSAKGREWKKVYLLNCNEGAMPYSSEVDQLEEERRLFYVALTRAKKELVLCAPKLGFTKEFKTYNCQISSFLEEINHLPKEESSAIYPQFEKPYREVTPKASAKSSISENSQPSTNLFDEFVTDELHCDTESSVNESDSFEESEIYVRDDIDDSFEDTVYIYD